MIPIGPRCSGCLNPTGTDRAVIDVEVDGVVMPVHAIGACRRLLAEAPDMPEVPARRRPSATVTPTGRQPRPEPLPAGRARVCADHLTAGRPDLWSDDTALGSRGYPKRRAVTQRAARAACIGCPSLTACVEYAQAFEWSAGVTVAGWTSSNTFNSPVADRLHPGLAAVLAQARRDRAESRRARSRPAEETAPISA